MEKMKNGLSLLLKRFKISSSSTLNIKSYWRIIMIIYLGMAVSLLFGGWFIYSWAITTSSILIKQKKIKAPITLEEVRKAETILQSKKGQLEEVINMKVNVVGLK